MDHHAVCTARHAARVKAPSQRRRRDLLLCEGTVLDCATSFFFQFGLYFSTNQFDGFLPFLFYFSNFILLKLKSTLKRMELGQLLPILNSIKQLFSLSLWTSNFTLLKIFGTT